MAKKSAKSSAAKAIKRSTKKSAKKKAVKIPAAKSAKKSSNKIPAKKAQLKKSSAKKAITKQPAKSAAKKSPASKKPNKPIPASRKSQSTQKAGTPTRPKQQKGDLKVSVLRRDDMLALEFEFSNLHFTGTGKKEFLTPIGDKGDPLVIVHFVPQSIAEQAFFEVTKGFGQDGDPVPPLKLPQKVESLLSGPTRLVFKVPNGQPVPFKLSELLKKLSEYKLCVAPAALPKEGVLLTSPTKIETAIEAPYKLIVSPNNTSVWKHRNGAFAKNSRVELWHTNLNAGEQAANTIRAIWTKDWPEVEPSGKPFEPKTIVSGSDPFQASLNSEQRQNIVFLSSRFKIEQNLPQGAKKNYVPTPIIVDRLMLSALGAWMDVRGNWNLDDELKAFLSVQGWQHRGTMAREHYVNVVEAGYLFPFGHQASRITITERKFHPNPKTTANTAYLRQRTFVIVQEPVKSYVKAGKAGSDDPTIDRRLPYRNVRISTRVTPDLDPPPTENTEPDWMLNAFWLKVGGQPFPFHAVAEDLVGRNIEFTAPVIFVPSSDPRFDAMLEIVKANYSTLGNSESIDRRLRLFNGQAIAFTATEKDSTQSGNSSFNVDSIEFGAEVFKMADTSLRPPFYPIVQNATVEIPSLKLLLGNEQKTKIEYHQTYNDFGFMASKNQGQLFAKIADDTTKPSLNFDKQAERAGALMRPNMEVSGLSRQVGLVTVSSLDNFAGGSKPKNIAGELFPGSLDDLPKIFGCISITDILNFDEDKPLHELLPSFDSNDQSVTFTFNPKIKKDSLGIFSPQKADPSQPDPRLNITVVVRKQADGDNAPGADVTCWLENFAIELLPGSSLLKLIRINFSKMEFTVKPGKKPDFDVKMGEIQFLGVLSFVEALRTLIPLDGFSDPPSLDITANGINTGFSLGLPAIAVGMFSLQNISFGAALTIPFIGQPVSFQFNFCERHNPFTLTVSGFGGGGFLGLMLTPNGVDMLEGALEFGAALAMSFGVAAGSVSVMGGVYFKIETGKTQLEGYLRIRGCVSVLGLISASIELYLALAYFTDSGKCIGKAELKIGVKVAFFKKTVTITCERKFAGSNGDPSFRQLMEPTPEINPWAEYCAAFA